jgi:hypothetical protein
MTKAPRPRLSVGYFGVLSHPYTRGTIKPEALTTDEARASSKDSTAFEAVAG